MWYIILAFVMVIGLGSLAINVFLFLLGLVVVLSFLAGYKIYEWFHIGEDKNE